MALNVKQIKLMAINKTVTTGKGLRHLAASYIRGAQVDEESHQGYIAVSTMNMRSKDKPTARQSLLRVTPAVYKRVANGYASVLKELQPGLVGRMRYNFILVTEKDKDGNKDNEVVKNIHLYPNSNTIASDATIALKIPVDENNAVVQLFPSGDIDVLAFPAILYPNIRDFITKLEELDSVDETTEFTFKSHRGDIDVSTSLIYGNRVTFMLRIPPERH